MTNTKKIKKTIQEEQIISKTCDICGETHTKNEEECFDKFSNFVTIPVRGGYGNEFIQDGFNCTLDICEKCFVENVLLKTKTANVSSSFNYSKEEISKEGFYQSELEIIKEKLDN